MEQEERISFINRFRIAIFKLESYGLFLIEKVYTSFKYLVLLILLVSIIMSIFSAFYRYKMVKTAMNYINNDLPDFSYSKEKLSFEKNVHAYDDEYDFRLIIDTNDNLDEKNLSEYKNEFYPEDTGIIVLNDKLIYITGLTEKIILLNELDFEISNKQDLLNEINKMGILSIVFSVIIIDFLVYFIYNLAFAILSVLVVASIGYLASFVCKIRIRYSSVITLAIYSLTLSIVLSGIYDIVYLYTKFVIDGFYTMYLFIAFIYIIAAMFMIKTDLLKQHVELQRIIEVQKEVREEQEEESQEEKERKEKDKDNETKEEKDKEEPNVENREPDGSEI